MDEETLLQLRLQALELALRNSSYEEEPSETVARAETYFNFLKGA